MILLVFTIDCNGDLFVWVTESSLGYFFLFKSFLEILSSKKIAISWFFG